MARKRSVSIARLESVTADRLYGLGEIPENARPGDTWTDVAGTRWLMTESGGRLYQGGPRPSSVQAWFDGERASPSQVRRDALVLLQRSLPVLEKMAADADNGDPNARRDFLLATKLLVEIGMSGKVVITLPPEEFVHRVIEVVANVVDGETLRRIQSDLRELLTDV